MSLFGIRRVGRGRYEVAIRWSIYVVPTLGDAIRLRLENWY